MKGDFEDFFLLTFIIKSRIRKCYCWKNLFHYALFFFIILINTFIIICCFIFNHPIINIFIINKRRLHLFSFIYEINNTYIINR